MSRLQTLGLVYQLIQITDSMWKEAERTKPSNLYNFKLHL